jgi:outer membrane protein OmpA-like peptidoglycan-associated protein
VTIDEPEMFSRWRRCTVRASILVTALLAATAGVADGAAAQRGGQYEFGLFGAYTHYDPAFAMNDAFGGGARLGYLISNRVGLEADLLLQQPYNVGSGRMEPIVGGASLVLNAVAASRFSLYLLGGYSRLDFGNVNPYRFTDGGFHGGAGTRLFIGPNFALRLEGRAVYTPSTNSGFTPDAVTHFIGYGGLSFFHRPGPPRALKDTDQDKVVDKKDACPSTPLGATVDLRGCPSDADTDTVLDGLDQCAATPAGARVDPHGCPTDADSDKVFDGLDECPDTPVGAAVDAKGCPGDQDGDKVLNGLDRCPDTPAGAAVDVNGCPADADGDKILDGRDKCPNTPAGVVVDGDGCPLDSDLDGVYDGPDKCPGTIPGTRVDATGCPVASDLDGDGVDDRADRCPNTPRGSRVDAVGCTVLFQEERVTTPGGPARPTLVLRGVNFQTGRSVLLPQSYVVLNDVAASLVANPEVRIEIAGYTDNTGTLRINNSLSQARAAAVRAYLAAKGVRPDRMVARGFGPSNPVASNATPAGRAQNRRVELHKLN